MTVYFCAGHSCLTLILEIKWKFNYTKKDIKPWKVIKFSQFFIEKTTVSKLFIYLPPLSESENKLRRNSRSAHVWLSLRTHPLRSHHIYLNLGCQGCWAHFSSPNPHSPLKLHHFFGNTLDFPMCFQGQGKNYLQEIFQPFSLVFNNIKPAIYDFVFFN